MELYNPNSGWKFSPSVKPDQEIDMSPVIPATKQVIVALFPTAISPPTVSIAESLIIYRGKIAKL